METLKYSFVTPTPDSKPSIRQAKEKIENEKLNLVHKFIEKELPETDERIAEPMNQSCDVAVVVPVYGERSYILRMMKSLAEQKNVSSDMFELIIVVNNPPKQPSKLPHETAPDYSHKISQYNKAVIENQETLELLQAIKGDKSKTEIDESEQNIIEKIKSSGLKIHVIDKATVGKTLPENEANVGGARNRGVVEAVERFLKNNKNGIIAQTDGDSMPANDYIYNLIKIFRERPELVGLVGKLEFEPELGNRIVNLAQLYQDIETAYTTMLNIMGKENIKLEDNVEGLSFFDNVNFSGANMASRAFEAAIVGGVPKIAGAEDPIFGQRLSKIGTIDRIPEIVVRTAERFSARTDVSHGGGWGNIKRADALETEGSIKANDPEAEMTIQMIRRELAEAMINKKTDPETLSRILSFRGKPILSQDENIILSQELNKEGDVDFSIFKQNETVRILSEKVIGNIIKSAPPVPIMEATGQLLQNLKKDPKLLDLYEKFKAKFTDEENSWIQKRRDKVKQLFQVAAQKINEGGSFDKNSAWKLLAENQKEIGFDQPDIEYLSEQPNFLNQMAEIINSSSTEEEIINAFENILSKVFILVENNPLQLRLIELRAMYEAYRKAYNRKY